MSRPIPVEIIPSHVHLSHADHAALFGQGHAGTITASLSQHGQYAYEENVQVSGRLKRALTLRVLGPQRKETQVELTPTEAENLGLKPPFTRSGDLSKASSCKLKGPKGEVTAEASVIIPKPHLHLSDADAKLLRVEHGDEVKMEISGETTCLISNVVVRVHPTYRPRLHIHQDIAREHWLTGVLHARLRDVNER
jgi:putative phosphotransacetylase